MACLIISEGHDQGKKLALEQHRLVMIGRDKDCTFQILDDQISRHHLQMKWDLAEGRHLAIDYGSSNGVYVNGARIAQETPLGDGDLIFIGNTTLVYMTEDSPDAQRVAEAMKKGGETWRNTVVFGRPPEE